MEASEEVKNEWRDLVAQTISLPDDDSEFD